MLDSIHRYKIINISQLKEYPVNFKRLIWMTCGGRLSSKGSYTNGTQSFNVKVGERHSSALSVILFNLVLDYIIKKLGIRGIFSFVFGTYRKCYQNICLSSQSLSKYLFIIAIFPFNLLARVSAKNLL